MQQKLVMSHPDRRSHSWSRTKTTNKTVIVKDLKSKSSCIHMLCNDVICFRPAKKSHFSRSALGLHVIKVKKPNKISSKQRNKAEKRARMT